MNEDLVKLGINIGVCKSLGKLDQNWNCLLYDFASKVGKNHPALV